MVSPTARVAFGLPTMNGEAHLAESLESLLSQTMKEFVVVVVDDGSTDETQQIARRYAAVDERVILRANDKRLGLVGNWRRALDLCRELVQTAEYFAWASDHDIWHARWLETLVAELDAHPEAMLAYPYTLRISERGADVGFKPRICDTAGIGDPAERLRVVIHSLKAGDAVYGLMRVEPLVRCGSLPLVVSPDRLLLTRLAVEGEFRQVPRYLWFRRYRQGVQASQARQRRTFYPDGIPLSAYVPWPLAHGYRFGRIATAELPLGTELKSVHFRETMRFASTDWKHRRFRSIHRWRKRSGKRHRRRAAKVVSVTWLALPMPLRRRLRPVARRLVGRPRPRVKT